MFKALGAAVIIKPENEFWKEKHPYRDDDNNVIVYELEAGEVVSVGPGSFSSGFYEPVGVKVGDRVFFEPDDPRPISYQGETYIKIESYEIVGVEDPRVRP
jgi:co-chaperonin GroES (HSP10)